MGKTGMLVKEIYVPDGNVSLPGSLAISEESEGIVLFAHGSGSSRHSPRNNYVAGILQQYGLGTLLMDLLTQNEDSSYEVRFDITLLARRLLAATKWLREQPETESMSIGYFGASTGAAAAIQAAATTSEHISAIVSRGGRPDLAWAYLGRIKAPILLITGELDDTVTELNRRAYEEIKAVKQMEIIPGATHLFEETGTLEKVSVLTASWFKKYMSSDNLSKIN